LFDRAGHRTRDASEEIANLIVDAVSDAASYINGAERVADNAMDKS
jgi:hypothetical protein